MGSDDVLMHKGMLLAGDHQRLGVGALLWFYSFFRASIEQDGACHHDSLRLFRSSEPSKQRRHSALELGTRRAVLYLYDPTLGELLARCRLGRQIA